MAPMNHDKDPELKPGLAIYNGKIHCYHCHADNFGPDHECKQMCEAGERGENGEVHQKEPEKPLVERVAQLELELKAALRTACVALDRVWDLEKRIYGNAKGV